MERDMFNLKGENASINAMLENERRRINAFEEKMAQYEDTVTELNRQLKQRDSMIHDMKLQLNQKQQIICQKEMEKENQERKFHRRLANETDKLTKEIEQKNQNEQQKMKVRVVDGSIAIRALLSKIFFFKFSPGWTSW